MRLFEARVSALAPFPTVLFGYCLLYNVHTCKASIIGVLKGSSLNVCLLSDASLSRRKDCLYASCSKLASLSDMMEKVNSVLRLSVFADHETYSL